MGDETPLRLNSEGIEALSLTSYAARHQRGAPSEHRRPPYVKSGILAAARASGLTNRLSNPMANAEWRRNRTGLRRFPACQGVAPTPTVEIKSLTPTSRTDQTRVDHFLDQGGRTHNVGKEDAHRPAVARRVLRPSVSAGTL